MIKINRSKINDSIISHLNKYYENEPSKSYESEFTLQNKYNVIVPFEVRNGTITLITQEDENIYVEEIATKQEVEFQIETDSDEKSIQVLYENFIEEFEVFNGCDEYKYYDSDRFRDER